MMYTRTELRLQLKLKYNILLIRTEHNALKMTCFQNVIKPIETIIDHCDKYMYKVL